MYNVMFNIFFKFPMLLLKWRQVAVAAVYCTNPILDLTLENFPFQFV